MTLIKLKSSLAPFKELKIDFIDSSVAPLSFNNLYMGADLLGIFFTYIIRKQTSFNPLYISAFLFLLFYQIKILSWKHVSTCLSIFFTNSMALLVSAIVAPVSLSASNILVVLHLCS